MPLCLLLPATGRPGRDGHRALTSSRRLLGQPITPRIALMMALLATIREMEADESSPAAFVFYRSRCHGRSRYFTLWAARGVAGDFAIKTLREAGRWAARRDFNLAMALPGAPATLAALRFRLRAAGVHLYRYGPYDRRARRILSHEASPRRHR